VLPTGLRAEIDGTTWTPAPIFELIAARGGVAPEEMERTFNLGVGMVAVVPSDVADAAVDLLTARGVGAWVCGHIGGSRVR
jgi:phosphoribosylformylglycinamidine cyclo-ligase